MGERLGGGYFALFGHEQGGTRIVDKVGLVLTGGSPLGRLSSGSKRREVIEPELGHSVESWQPHNVWIGDGMALHQPPEPGDSATDRAMDVVPVE